MGLVAVWLLRWRAVLKGGNGEARPRQRRRLTEGDVVLIREARAAGSRCDELAARFGLGASTVSLICIGRSWKRAGGPITREKADRTRPLADRFWDHVAKASPDDCWPWTDATDPDGYGLFFAKRRAIRANRFALELKLGRPLGPDELARHTCDNPPCCNPAHLNPGSVADNNSDTVKRERQSRGEEHARARLTETDVLSIRRLAGTTSFAALGRRFGVTGEAISAVVSGRCWKHVQDTAVQP